VHIREISSSDTHPLRASVLRNDTPITDVDWDGDDEPSTFHLGVRLDDDTLVAISTWLERAHPAFEGKRSMQVRGMATAPSHRNIGLGSILLESGLTLCRQRGVEIVWARARVPALRFYERHGFGAIGEQYIDPTTALPHVDIATEAGREPRGMSAP
jgi:predicted GNAT family N-acyltransferase